MFTMHVSNKPCHAASHNPHLAQRPQIQSFSVAVYGSVGHPNSLVLQHKTKQQRDVRDSSRMLAACAPILPPRHPHTFRDTQVDFFVRQSVPHEDSPQAEPAEPPLIGRIDHLQPTAQLGVPSSRNVV